MRCLNEPIARRANLEDDCTGRFWQGRFRSKGLPDERAMWAAMAYDDLNPISAGMAEDVDDDEHTSLQRRLEEAEDEPERLDEPMAPLVRRDRKVASAPPPARRLDMTLREYRAYVEWTGGMLHDEPARVPNERAPPAGLGDPKSWLDLVMSCRQRVPLPLCLAGLARPTELHSSVARPRVVDTPHRSNPAAAGPCPYQPTPKTTIESAIAARWRHYSSAVAVGVPDCTTIPRAPTKSCGTPLTGLATVGVPMRLPRWVSPMPRCRCRRPVGVPDAPRWVSPMPHPMPPPDAADAVVGVPDALIDPKPESYGSELTRLECRS